MQGDVLAIVDKNGDDVAWYGYDTWGQLSGSSGSNAALADANPIRYRGYYYDDETGWYWLQTRYYNPTWCRFINADCMFIAGNLLTGSNMYAYCNGNPVMYIDPNGMEPSGWGILGVALNWLAQIATIANRLLLPFGMNINDDRAVNILKPFIDVMLRSFDRLRDVFEVDLFLHHSNLLSQFVNLDLFVSVVGFFADGYVSLSDWITHVMEHFISGNTTLIDMSTTGAILIDGFFLILGNITSTPILGPIGFVLSALFGIFT